MTARGAIKRYCVGCCLLMPVKGNRAQAVSNCEHQACPLWTLRPVLDAEGEVRPADRAGYKATNGNVRRPT